MPDDRRRASYLTPHQINRLDAACIPIRAAFGPFVFLCGSVMTRPDYRDVDVRALVPDQEFQKLFLGAVPQVDGAAHQDPLWKMICMAVSGELSNASGMNVDFQVQSMELANVAYPEPSNRIPIGMRWP